MKDRRELITIGDLGASDELGALAVSNPFYPWWPGSTATVTIPGLGGGTPASRPLPSIPWWGVLLAGGAVVYGTYRVLHATRSNPRRRRRKGRA